MNLFQNLVDLLRNPSKSCVSVIRSAASLVYHTLNVACEETDRIESFKLMSNLIKEWIDKSKVVEENMFGYKDTAPSQDSCLFPKGMAEIEVCTFY